MATPNPSILANKKTLAAIVAVTDKTAPAVTPAGVIRAKDAEPGMVVRAWLHNGARGSEYTIESVKPSRGGAAVRIEFVKPCQRPDGDYKAAYRFFVVRKVEFPKSEPAPTSRPVAKRRPRQPEHLTHTPFAGLKDLLG